MSTLIAESDRYIKNIVDACAKAGVVLVTHGGQIHGVPGGIIKKHPGLIALVRRRAADIGRYLDNLVE